MIGAGLSKGSILFWSYYGVQIKLFIYDGDGTSEWFILLHHL